MPIAAMTMTVVMPMPRMAPPLRMHISRKANEGYDVIQSFKKAEAVQSPSDPSQVDDPAAEGKGRGAKGRGRGRGRTRGAPLPAQT